MDIALHALRVARPKISLYRERLRSRASLIPEGRWQDKHIGSSFCEI